MCKFLLFNYCDEKVTFQFKFSALSQIMANTESTRYEIMEELKKKNCL